MARDAERYATQVPLHGRDREIALVREMLERPEHDGRPASRRVPVLVFTGARGSGKTALLADLANRCRERIPFARLDCARLERDHPDGEERGAARMPQVLAALAFQLSRPCPRYGAVEFARLITGQLALEPQIEVAQWEKARNQIDEALRTYSRIPDPPDYLGELAGELLTTVPGLQDAPVQTVAQRLPGWIVSAVNSVRSSRGNPAVGRDWYGEQDRGLSLRPIDVLVDLNHKAHEPAAEGGDEVGELLWAAFLADLREGFARGRRAETRTLNCTVLLDNVDTPAGLALLDGLTGARERRAHGIEPDPLTVVATSRTDLSARGPGAAVASIESACYADAVRGGVRAPSRYSVRLDDLSQGAVGNMVAALGPKVRQRQVTAAVHRFTGGHALSTRRVLDALAEQGLAEAQLGSLLPCPVRPSSREEPVPLEELLLAELLAGSEEAAAALITTSAARDLEQALQLVNQSALAPEVQNRQQEVFSAALWSSVDAAAHRTMPRVQRTLLLRRLAARTEADAADWSSVHGWLRRYCENHGDEVGALHHRLAAGEVRPVAERMTALLKEVDAHEWLRRLHAVCAAPNELEPGGSPVGRVRELTRWADAANGSDSHPGALLAAVARLVVAVWTAADPLLVPGRELRGEIAADLDQIAPRSGEGLEAFRAEADRYR